MSIQAPKQVVMVRPHHFRVNDATLEDNAFQRSVHHTDVSKQAYIEVSQAVEKLRAHGITVHLFEDKSIDTPDSVFPNNWFSTHHSGTLITYPMRAENRRKEYRQDVLETLWQQYGFEHAKDLRHFTDQQRFLEGTGSIVFDHVHKLAYMARSQRTDDDLLKDVCDFLGYEAMIFDAYDAQGTPVYHTNVMMCVGTHYVMIGLDMLAAPQRTLLCQRFERNQQTVIALTHEQIQHFCGNAIELQGKEGALLALSQTAYDALTIEQRATILQHATLLPLSVSTIEAAGGSVRCMIAGVHG